MGKLTNNNYNVIILAAGSNTRFKNTILMPKCLLKFKDKSLIEIIIFKLRKIGFKEVNIVVGYKKEKIKEHLSSFKNIKIKYIFNKKYKKYGSGYSWYEALKKVKLKKKCLLLHADILFDDSYLKDILKSKKKDLILQTSFNKNNLTNKSLVLKSDKNRKITGIGYKIHYPKSRSEIVCINKISLKTLKKFYSFIKEYFKDKKNRLKTWELVFNDFIIESKIQVFNQGYTKKKWFNINTQRDYIRAKNNF